ncbi:MAG: FxsA family protein [Gammaproteobacteria bacterium]|nr:FxsA family protein [Gammaproteobacteria bacterium]
MFKFLFTLFIVVPIVEMYVLLQVGSVIGAIPTIAMVVFTAMLGSVIIRIQGLATFLRFREKTLRGEMPAEEMLTGMALLVAGALLLTPGFVTDAVGFLLLVPAVRRYLLKRIIAQGIFTVHRQAQYQEGPVTIEGEFRKED